MPIPKILGSPLQWQPAGYEHSGANPAFIANGHHVKKLRPWGTPAHVIAATEVLHPKIFKELGLPHHEVETFSHEGNHFIHAPLGTGWVNLDEAPADRFKDVDHKVAAHTLAAEYYLGVGDRHGGNYVFKPGEKNPVPIDMGLSNDKDNHPDGFTHSESEYAMAMKNIDPRFVHRKIDPEFVKSLLRFRPRIEAVGAKHRLHRILPDLARTGEKLKIRDLPLIS